MSKVLFVTIHHKKSLLYEEGIKLLLDKGYPVLIYNTGLDEGFGKFGIEHPKLTYIDAQQHLGYDAAVAELSDFLLMREWDIVHFIDNDLFITDPEYIIRTLKDFKESDLGFASYFENGYGNDEREYIFKNTLAEVTDQAFANDYPFHRPSWENAAMMFKREAWDKVTDWLDMKYYIPEMHNKGVKLGTKKKEARLKYSHACEGFIHIGRLMDYYYLLEDMDNKLLTIEPLIDKSRIGYFLYQRQKFGEGIYSEKVNSNLDGISKQYGPQKCLDAFLELTKGYYA